MLRYVVRRLLLLVPILLGLSILIFVWVRALPGSPAESLLGERATPQLVAAYNKRYGLNEPVYKQYFKYVRTTLEGDLGVSGATRRKVTDEIRDRFPATAELALAAMLFAISLGIPLGFLAAKRYGGIFDQGSLLISLIGISIPVFVLAVILKYIFAVRLGWLPSVGRIDLLNFDAKHPTGFYVLDAILTRDSRASVLDVQNEDYVRTARAKGVAPRIVDRRHVLRNALLPVTTVIGLQTGLLLSGAILTETVFAFPGMGSWLRDAIFNHDYPVLQGGIMFLAVVFVLVNLVVDVLYAVINPRIRYG
jgi:peptide/nickel transport system permease protein